MLPGHNTPLLLKDSSIGTADHTLAVTVNNLEVRNVSKATLVHHLADIEKP